MSHQIRASSLRRQHFSNTVENLGLEKLQLLRDVDTRWSSTLLMIERVLLLRPVCIIIVILLAH